MTDGLSSRSEIRFSHGSLLTLVIFSSFFLEFKMTLVQPNPEMQLRIRSELNENVDTRAQDLQTIKEWLELQPHLPKTYGKFEERVEFLKGAKINRSFQCCIN